MQPDADGSTTLPVGWKNVFVGREQEQAALREAWLDTIGGENRDRPPRPQFAIVFGETGTGKSRLVQKFYQSIAGPEFDPDNYWPDAFVDADQSSLGVNPDFSGHSGGTTVPFIWWGLRWPPLDGRNQVSLTNGLQQHLEHLVPHMDGVFRWLTLVAGKESFSLGLEEGLDAVAGHFGPWVAIGVKAAKALKGIAMDVLSRKASSARVAEKHEKSESDLDNRLMSFFRMLFTPKFPGERQVPLVLWLDDAQWIDEATLRFLDRLLRDAGREHWPLMVVATCWSGDWAWQSGIPPTFNETRSGWDYQRLPQLPACEPILGRVPETSARAEVAGLTVRAIPLQKLDSLESVVRYALPGLTKEERRTLVEKAAGNPFWLRLLIERCERNPDWFEGRDLGSRLVNREAFLSLDGDPTELASNKFSAVSAELRRALAIGAMQGTSFLSRLVHAVAANERLQLNADAARLDEADDPHAIVQTRAAGQLREFRVPQFRAAAKQEFTGRVGRRAMDALKAELCAILLDNERFAGLGRDEQADAVKIALSPEFELWAADEPLDFGEVHCRGFLRAQWWSFLRAKDEQMWGDALALASGLAKVAGDTGLPLDLFSASEQGRIADFLAHFGGTDHRSAGRVLLEPLCRLLAADPNRRVEHARALVDLGDLFIKDGAYQEAHGVFVEALTEYEAVAAESGSPKARRNVVVALGRIANIQRVLGDHASAIDTFQRCLAIIEATAAEPRTPETRRDVAVALCYIADIEQALGDHVSALDKFRRSLVISEALAAEVGTPEARRDVAVDLGCIAEIEQAVGDHASALDKVRRCLAISETLAAELGTPAARRDVAVDLGRIADIEQALGDHASALDKVRRCLAISEALAAELGTPEARQDVTVDLGRIADIEQALGDHGAALDSFRRSLAIRESLAADLGTPTARRGVAVALCCIADSESALGDHVSALDKFRRSLVISEALAAELGTPEVRRDVAVALGRIAESEQAIGDRTSALDKFRQQLAISEALAAELETPAVRRDVAVALVRIADIEQALGDRGFALDKFRRCLAISEALAADLGTPEAWQDVAVALGRVADSEQALGNHTSALEKFRRSLAISEAIAAELGTTEARRDVLFVRDRIATVERCREG